jgi:hypothetical protein
LAGLGPLDLTLDLGQPQFFLQPADFLHEPVFFL